MRLVKERTSEQTTLMRLFILMSFNRFAGPIYCVLCRIHMKTKLLKPNGCLLDHTERIRIAKGFADTGPSLIDIYIRN